MIIVMTSLGLTSNDLNEQTKLSVETSPHFALKDNRGGTVTSSFVAASRSRVLGTNSVSAESAVERSLYLDVKGDDPVIYGGGSGSDRILDSV